MRRDEAGQRVEAMPLGTVATGSADGYERTQSVEGPPWNWRALNVETSRLRAAALHGESGRRSVLKDDDGTAVPHVIVEVDHVLVQQADAAG